MTTMRIIISPQADLDLQEIWSYIAADNEEAASSIVRNIGTQINLLASFPRIGMRRPDIKPKARVWNEKPYLIVYETVPDTNSGPIKTVEIVRVVDGRRDLTKLF